MPDLSALDVEVADALARGGVVVTANQRAARVLRRSFDVQQQAAGLMSWHPPTILAWETWQDSLYRQLVWQGCADDVLLNGSQEHALWRAVVSEDASTKSLRPMDALAEAAASAWALLHAYSARDRLHRYAGNSDTRVFAAWATEFERRLRRAQCVTTAQLPHRLREAIAARQAVLPNGIFLVGFDTITPAQRAVMDAARSIGVEVTQAGEGPAALTRPLATLGSERDEMAACANWVRAHLERDPAARVGVIVPAIEPVRARLEREFRRVLAPELNDIAATTVAAPYEFSLGVPLAQVAMASVALELLRWSLEALPLERVSSLLLSPYFAAGRHRDERLARAELDAFTLRRHKMLQPRFTADALRRVIARWDRAADVPALLNHLGSLCSAFGESKLPLLRTHADWAERMADLLSAAGWALSSELDTVEFQLRRKWDSALDELASLDFDRGRVPFSQALGSLEHIARRTLFAPESRNAPIQILGPLEAAGSKFDAIWFLRANDTEWATTASPNPLLPWQLQRDLNMPGAVPSRDAELALNIARRIARSSAEVVFSYAHDSADGPQRPSAVLGELDLEPLDISERHDLRNEPYAAVEVVSSEPALPAPPDLVLRGGAAVLEKQAACGFRAFAEMRLFSAAPDARSPGLDARERGSVVHRVLELFWTGIRSQAELRSLTTDQRDAMLDDCIVQAVGEQTRTLEGGWSTAYIDAERQRLRNLLRPWLDYEAQRPPFLVKAVEDAHPDVRIGPLRLFVKVDRVDTSLLEGEPAGEIILDYKTNNATPADWVGDRPDAPQLPLYAVVSGIPEITGVAFAKVRPGSKSEIRGLQARPGVLPKAAKLSGSLSEQILAWNATLVRLAEDFHSGKTDVRPKAYPETCRFCQQRLLCRLDVSMLSADETDEVEEVFVEEEYG